MSIYLCSLINGFTAAAPGQQAVGFAIYDITKKLNRADKS